MLPSKKISSWLLAHPALRLYWAALLCPPAGEASASVRRVDGTRGRSVSPKIFLLLLFCSPKTALVSLYLTTVVLPT